MQFNALYKIHTLRPKAANVFLHSWITLVEKFQRVGDWKGMVGIIIGLGIIFRIFPYLQNRSLWLDEAMLASGILRNSFSQLLGPIDYGQMAPVGFLFIEKFLVLTFGESEYALRLFPLMMGILSLFLFYGVGRRILTHRGFIIALGLFAVSGPLLYYSSELKQYSSDVAIALGISLLGLKCLENKSRIVFSLFLFSLAGAILIWFSHPAIFSLAGAGIALTLYYKKTLKWQDMAWLALPACFWLGSFSANYFMITSPDLSQNSQMVKAWSGSTAFPPVTPFSVESLMWHPRAFFLMFLSPGGLRFNGLAAFCFVVGWATIFTQKRYACYMLTLPILFALFASLLHKYPFGHRLILFFVPAMMIFIGDGVDRIIALAKPTGWVVGVSLCALLMLYPVQTAFFRFLTPGGLEREEVRPVMTYLSQNYQKGDKLYLYDASKPAFNYYGKRVGLEKIQYQGGVSSKKNWDNYIDDLRGLRGNDRVWLLFSHVHKDSGVDEEKLFVHLLDRMGKQIDSFKRTGASVYLYDLQSHPTE